LPGKRISPPTAAKAPGSERDRKRAARTSSVLEPMNGALSGACRT
jgi:hypothetical protein